MSVSLPELNVSQVAEGPHGLSFPKAVYRLQFNRDFTFQHAIALVPYLASLGISHCYASPLLMSKKGSTHGYDIIDHNRIDPEIGHKSDFEQLIDTLHQNQMGLLLDIVPNHMGIGKNNHLWMNVLKYGMQSEYAHYFDIDWFPVNTRLSRRLLLPVLGEFYGVALEKNQFTLEPMADGFALNYGEHTVPVCPESYPLLLHHLVQLPTAKHDQTIRDALTQWLDNWQSQALKYVKPEDKPDIEIAFNQLIDATPGLENWIHQGLTQLNALTGDAYSQFFHRLLEKQHYRLAYWQTAQDDINYRRFFDVNDLVGIRIEDPDVFDYAHQTLFNLIAEGKVDGVRVDHPDGLYNPGQYFKQLQAAIAQRKQVPYDPAQRVDPAQLPFYVVVEKILAFEEPLEAWPVHGTTGYDFISILNEVFVQADHEKAFNQIYQAFVGRHFNYDQALRECKRLIMQTSLSSELNTLANLLKQISEACWYYRDFTLNLLREALRELVTHFTVYRTYITPDAVPDSAKTYIGQAIEAARRATKVTDPSVFEFLQNVLLLQLDTEDAAVKAQITRFVMKFQQFTGPVMAKSFEDTFFYRYYRLVSLNEVGGEVKTFGFSPQVFHQANQIRARRFPYSLLASSTHDTKRSEDTRARLNVLSELPEQWQNVLTQWAHLNSGHKTVVDNRLAPSKNDEYLFYQTMLGIWPVMPPDAAQMQALQERLQAYMIKACREGKQHSSWLNPHTDYETALTDFIQAILSNSHSPFFASFNPFLQRLAHVGYLNTLSQTLLKLTSPGIPDVYQGTECYAFNLVDPDNRRPVAYDRHNSLLAEVRQHGNLPLPWTAGDDRTKLHLIQQVLALRHQHPAVFTVGDYVPLTVGGHAANHVIAFARVHGDVCVVVIVARFMASLVQKNGQLPFKKSAWTHNTMPTTIELPDTLAKPEADWVNGLTGETLSRSPLNVQTLLANSPVALLIRQ
jgi:(1->4)-alpha-D-glucan 1-alpha-D-glucosylmutase